MNEPFWRKPRLCVETVANAKRLTYPMTPANLLDVPQLERLSVIKIRPSPGDDSSS